MAERASLNLLKGNLSHTTNHRHLSPEALQRFGILSRIKGNDINGDVQRTLKPSLSESQGRALRDQKQEKIFLGYRKGEQKGLRCRGKTIIKLAQEIRDLENRYLC